MSPSYGSDDSAYMFPVLGFRPGFMDRASPVQNNTGGVRPEISLAKGKFIVITIVE